MGKIQELPHGEIAGMRRHEAEKTGFGFGVAESAEIRELGLVNAHTLEAKDRRG
jgi:hypothetical protein